MTSSLSKVNRGNNQFLIDLKTGRFCITDLVELMLIFHSSANKILNVTQSAIQNYDYWGTLLNQLCKPPILQWKVFVNQLE